MTQVQPDRAHPPDALSEPFTPGAPTNPPELADFPETLAGPLPAPLADPRTRHVRRGVAQRLLQLLLLGPQVLPRGLPGHPGRAQRVVDADRLPRQRRRDGARRARHRRRRRRLRELHPVRRLRAALPEHPVHRRLLPLPHPHGRRRQGGPRARRRERRPPAGLAVWNERTDLRTHEPVLGETPVSQETGARLGRRASTSRSAARRSCSSTARPRSTGRRCRGRSPRCCRLAGYEFGLMGDQWCCGGPAAEMGYVEQAQRFARHNLDNWRATGTKRVLVLDPHDYISFTEDYPKYFGEEFDIEVVLVLEVLAAAAPRGPAHPVGAGRPGDHLPRPVPAQQAQGHLGRAARDPARDPRADASTTSTG